MEQKLIGNLLEEEKDNSEEPQSRYPKTKRHVLLTAQEIASTQSRSNTAPIEPTFSFFSTPDFWTDSSRK
jgi:hypothetical protein